MAVVNTYFKKRKEQRMTYKSGESCTQVVHISCKKCDLKVIGDCKRDWAGKDVQQVTLIKDSDKKKRTNE